MKITLAENFRAVFYAPFYALKAIDLAGREGLEIELLPPRAVGAACDEVNRAAVDLTWGGPMKDHDNQPANASSLVSFGEVVSRDTFYLVGKTDATSFELSGLVVLRLGVVSEIHTPWLCLLADMQDAGFVMTIVAGTIYLQSELTMQQQLRALRDGTLDVCQLFEPYVSETLSRSPRSTCARTVSLSSSKLRAQIRTVTLSSAPGVSMCLMCSNELRRGQGLASTPVSRLNGSEVMRST